MSGEKPPEGSGRPSPARKGRAGIAVVAILIAMIVVIFVARNFEHAKELEESPPPATGLQG